MAQEKPKAVLITGASAGIGAAIAARLARAPFDVWGTSRRSDAPLPAPSVRMIQMDVRDPGSVSRGVDQMMAVAGRIDVLINNAGNGIAASVEDTSVADMTAQFDTNFYGPLRVCQAVIPIMRAQGHGRIIQISSLAARIGIPFQGAYSASKAALEGLSEALSIELAPFNIQVAMVEPGDTKTSFTAARVWTKRAKASAVYGERARYAVRVMEKSEQAGTDPDEVAKLVEEAIAAAEPKLRYVSASRTERFALLMQRLLPDRRFEAMIASAFERKNK
jgi:short-subunit dehydrogenase